MAKAKYQSIPDTDHFARLCSRQKRIIDPITKEFKGVELSFFELRKDELYLSGDWWEFFSGDIKKRMSNLILCLKARRLINLKKSHIVISNAGKIREVMTSYGREPRVENHGKAKDLSYSSISGLPLDNSDKELLAALATECVQDAFEIEVKKTT